MRRFDRYVLSATPLIALLASALTVAPAIGGPAGPGGCPESPAVLASVGGDVTVTLPDGPELPGAGAIGKALCEGSSVTTGSGSAAAIESPGTITVVMAPETRVILPTTGAPASALRLVSGSIHVTVRPGVDGGSLDLRKAQVVAGDTGATYAASEDGVESTVKVFDGVVSVVSLVSGDSIALGAGEMSVVSASGSTPAQPFDADMESQGWQAAIARLTAEAPGPSASLSPSPRPSATVPSGGDQFPDVLAVDLRPRGGGVYDVVVTISSPYDTPERYADGWRVLDPDGNVLGTHTLLHDHAAEQPFTRIQSGMPIPEGVTVVTVEGRDRANGYGGRTITVEVPDPADG